MLNSFFLNLYKFGISRIFTSANFLLATLAFIILERLTMGNGLKLNLNPCVDVLVGLFSFVFAALAIMVVFANGESKIGCLLKNKGSYLRVLFHYWYACAVYLAAILYVGGCVVFQIEDRLLMLIALWATIYSIFVTFEVVKVTISLAIYDNETRDLHNDNRNNSDD